MLAKNHKNKVNNPKDEAKTYKTNDTSNNFTFRETGNRAEKPSRERDDCADYAYYVRKTKVIAFFCLPFYKLLYILLSILYNTFDKYVNRKSEIHSLASRLNYENISSPSKSA